MSEIIDILISASFWAAVIRIASPLIFATMGELICERAGVLNLGIEGIMVIGAFTGWMAVYQGMPLWGGVAMAMAAGMLFGLLHSTLTVPFGLSPARRRPGRDPSRHRHRLVRLPPDAARRLMLLAWRMKTNRVRTDAKQHHAALTEAKHPEGG